MPEKADFVELLWSPCPKRTRAHKALLMPERVRRQGQCDTKVGIAVRSPYDDAARQFDEPNVKKRALLTSQYFTRSTPLPSSGTLSCTYSIHSDSALIRSFTSSAASRSSLESWTVVLDPCVDSCDEERDGEGARDVLPTRRTVEIARSCSSPRLWALAARLADLVGECAGRLGPLVALIICARFR